MSQFWVNSGTGGGNTPFAPNTTVNMYDDFIGNSSSDNGYLNWLEGSNNVFSQENGTSAHPGIIKMSSGFMTNITLFLGDPSFTGFGIALGGGTYAVNWVTSLVTLSDGVNRYINQQGMMDGVDGVTVNGVYFSYSDNVNGGKWLLNCTNAGVTTSVDSGVLAVTGFVNLGFTINAAGTSVTFSINSSTVGTAITTNIPTSDIGPMYKDLYTSGELPQSEVDLFYMSYTLTVPR